MARSLIEDAFDHHVWATTQLLDACAQLTPGQLSVSVPGTFGSVIGTIGHIVGGDCFYLHVLTGRRTPLIDARGMGLAELRAVMEANGAEWAKLLKADPDPDTRILEVDEDGYRRDAAVGIRLAQALHHGNDHRSQVCTALTTLGLEAPDVSVWKWGLDMGRYSDVWPQE